ncbi:unnamed protein product [Linum trigynum]|uniref:SRR1-like domain-containing protein n=1 Tax=Linum trigynum TaxID=586398 RepID=A0AAV2G9H1_9ROSI
MAASAKVLMPDKCAESHDGWTIVLPRGKRRCKKLAKIGSLGEKEGIVSWSPTDTESSEDMQSKLKNKMVGCMKRVESSLFCQNFLEHMQTQQVMDCFRKVLEGAEQKKMQMVVYGIGSIESHDTP